VAPSRIARMPPALSDRDQGARAALLPAAVVCAVFGVLGAALVDRGRSYGWDESMHAALPAARLVLAVKAGAWREAADVVLGCQQYPFVYPCALAAVELVAGISEGVARATGRVVWAAGAFGIFLAAREAVRCAGWPAEPARARLAPYAALALALLSPLALHFSGTLFQEAPFTALAAYAVWAWLRRDGSVRRELAAGGLVTLAFFTRFNTGLLLGLALALDLAVEAVLAARARALRPFLTRAALLAAIPAAAGAWWFLLPLPDGPARGADHRAALAAFLQGNRGAGTAIPWSQRWVDWTAAFAPTPRMLALEALALAGTLPALARRGVRTLWILFLAAGVPVWVHPFHLERFLLHQGVAIWCLAGLGLARFAPGPRPALSAAALLALAALVPALDARPLALRLLRPDPALVAYVEGALDEKGSLSPARPLATNGLAREEADRILDLVAEAAGPTGRVAWVGVNSELSPAAIHLGLLARGGSAERFRRDAARTRGDEPDMCVTFRDVDPGWDAERLRAWAGAFDVVFMTRPADFKGRGGRGFIERYQEELAGSPGWQAASLGVVEIARPARAAQAVEIIACRRR